MKTFGITLALGGVSLLATVLMAFASCASADQGFAFGRKQGAVGDGHGNAAGRSAGGGSTTYEKGSGVTREVSCKDASGQTVTCGSSR